MVEFALILPLLLLVVYGLIEAGRLLFIYSSVLTASREAARYGSAAGNAGGGTPHFNDCTGIRNAAIRMGGISGVSSGGVSIAYEDAGGTLLAPTCPAPNIVLGNRIHVHVETAYTPILPLVRFEPFTIKSDSRRTIIHNVEIQGTPIAGGTPSVYFAVETSQFAEDAGQVDVVVALNIPSANPVIVPFSVGGSASGADYVLGTASPIVFSPGETSKAIVIAIVDDLMDEPDEDIIFTLGTPTGATLGSPDTHTLTIVDNDEPPSMYFWMAAQDAPEDSGSVGINVVLSYVSGFDISVQFVVAGSATPTTDYTITSGPVLIPAGSTQGQIIATLVDDPMDEDTEQIQVTLQNPMNATLGMPFIHFLNILDNDNAPTIKFTWPGQAAVEGSAASAGITLSALTARQITLPYTISGTATQGADFTVPASPLIIPPGANSAAIPVNLLNDLVSDSGETVILTMGDPTNALRGTPYIHTIVITETTTTPSVSFTTESQTGSEGGGDMVITARLSHPTAYNVTVPFDLSGTATKDSDYIITDSPVFINAGQQETTITIHPIDDLLNEASETVVVTIGTPSNANRAAPFMHTATINDNDAPPTVKWKIDAQQKQENLGSMDVIAELSGPSGSPVVVLFAVDASSTATLNVDYTITSSPITITAGLLSAKATINIIDDILIGEPPETVIVNMTGATNAVVGNPNKHIATIIDDDTMACPDAGSFNFDGDKTYYFSISNNDPGASSIYISSVKITFPGSPGQKVKTITFGVDTIWSGNKPSPYIATCPTNQPQCELQANQTKNLSFVFSKYTAGTYSADVYWTNSCPFTHVSTGG